LPAELPDAAALGAALATLGLPCDVEASGHLAILVPRPGAPWLDRALRLEVTRVARVHGFTHVALEVTPEAGATLGAGTSVPGVDAALPRD
jgi:hypothetical protein